MVKEREADGSLVYNQPAGHLGPNETLIEAVHRETLEETGWHVNAEAILSMNLYTSPRNNITYFRCNFLANAVELVADASLDAEIEDVLWMSEKELRDNQHQLRSPLVLQAITDFQSGQRFPLSMIKNLLTES